MYFDNWPKLSIVTGLPRSGTSLMMNILSSSGIAVNYDDNRNADSANPNGYFENELVKSIPSGNTELLENITGFIKITSNYLPKLVDKFQINAIYMDRNLVEIAKSQAKMEGVDNIDINRHQDLLEKARSEALYLLKTRLNVRYLRVSYNDILTDQERCFVDISNFLNIDLSDSSKKVIDEKLYRNRSI